MTIAEVGAARRNQVPLGIAYMVGSTAMFAGGNAVVKWQLATYPLGEEPADEAHLKSLLAPYSSDGMMCWPVSPRVGGVKNNDPSLMEPIDLP